MNRDQKNKIQVIVLTIILILSIILAVKVFKGNNSNNLNEEFVDTLQTGIDFNSEAYDGKKIYERDGDLIIEDENGSQTIQTTKTKVDTGLREISEETAKEKYELLDVTVSSGGGNTIIRGKLRNNDSSAHELVINSKFYSEDNKIKGATSTKVSVGANETKDFSMAIMDSVEQYRHEIKVEYSN